MSKTLRFLSIFGGIAMVGLSVAPYDISHYTAIVVGALLLALADVQ